MDVETPQQNRPAQPIQPAQPSQPVHSQPFPPVQAPQPPPQPQQPHGGLPFGMTEDQLEDRINQLIGITGAERDQALAALRAAFFDVNMAVNYIFEGIPAQPGHPQDIPQGNGGQAGGNGGEDYGDLEASPEEQQGLAELQALVSNPAFHQLRMQARANPQIIPTILEHLRQSSPNIYQMLQGNPELLNLLLLGEPAGAGGAGGQGGARRPRGGNVIELTRDEMDAIERVA